MTLESSRTLVQTFIASHLDYCNSLLYNTSDGLLQRLQSVENAAAHLITGVRRYEHINPILHELH